MFETEQIQTLFLWLAAGAFLFVFIGGIANKFVIYYDTTDLFWSFSPFLFPFVGNIVGSSFVPEGKQISDSAMAQLFMVVAIIGAVYGAYRNFYASITHNGMTFGLVMGVFKSLVSLLVAVLSVGLLAKIFDKNAGLGKKMKAAAFLGILWWSASKLINGEEYYASRAMPVPAE